MIYLRRPSAESMSNLYTVHRNSLKDVSGFSYQWNLWLSRQSQPRSLLIAPNLFIFGDLVVNWKIRASDSCYVRPMLADFICNT